MQSAPVPRPKPKKQAGFICGVYVAENTTFQSVLWFHKDGTYGARWGQTMYEGTWRVAKEDDGRIHIMERELGNPVELRPWSVPRPGRKDGWFSIRLEIPFEPVGK